VKWIAIAGAALALCGCQNMPEPYAPPVQRQRFENFQPYRVNRVLNMADPDARDHFVQDIADKLEGTWRWTAQRPTVSLTPASNQHLLYSIEFTIPKVTFQETGPVTISFYVNDHLLERKFYPEAGHYVFEKPVPPEWVPLDKPSILAAEIDKVLAPKDEDRKYGFVLVKLGFAE